MRTKGKYKKRPDPILAEVERRYDIRLPDPHDTTAEEYFIRRGLPSLAEVVRLARD